MRLERELLLLLLLLLSLRLVALRRRLQLGQPHRAVREIVKRSADPGYVLRAMTWRMRFPLRLMLFPFEQLVVVPQMRRDAGVDMILCGHIMLDQPRRAVPRFSGDRLLNERPQNRLGEYFPVAEYVIAIHHSFLIRPPVYASKIAGDWLCQSTVRKNFTTQARLVAYYAG